MVENITPEELAELWKDKEPHFPISDFIIPAMWQFCMGIFPLIAIDYGLYYLMSLPVIANIMTITLQIIIAPFIFLINYLGYLYYMTLSVKWLNKFYDRKSAPQEGVFDRDVTKGNTDDLIRYYHIRGLLYKWPVFFSKKSFFPWSVNYVLREISNNIVSKDALIGDVFVGLEFTDIAEGAVILDGSSVSSHVVDSIFGALSILTVKIEKNAIISPNIIIGPGALIEEGMMIGPRCLLPKRWKNDAPKGNEFVWGHPVPNKKREFIHSVLDYIPEDFKNKYPIAEYK